jgi:hypothetical protein
MKNWRICRALKVLLSFVADEQVDSEGRSWRSGAKVPYDLNHLLALATSDPFAIGSLADPDPVDP